MNIIPGDLVSIRRDSGGPEQSGIILSQGYPVSVYFEDRPIRSISAIRYYIILNGAIKSIYDYEISKVLSQRGKDAKGRR